MSHQHKVVVVLVAIAMLAIASVATAGTALPKKYSGNTSQGMPMSLTVSRAGGGVTMAMKYRFSCPSLGQAFGTSDEFKMVLSARRTFGQTWDNAASPATLDNMPAFGTGELSLVWRGYANGTLGRTKAVGRYSEHLTFTDATGKVTQCDTGVIAFRLNAGKPASRALPKA